MSHADQYHQSLRRKVLELYQSSTAMTQIQIAALLGIPEVLVARILDSPR